MPARAPLLFGLRASIAAVLVAAVLVLAAAIVSLVVAIGDSASRAHANELFTRTAETIAVKTEALLSQPVSLARIASLDQEASAPVRGDGLTHPFLGFLEGALAANPAVYAVYVGNDDGTFLEVIQVGSDPRVATALGAPAVTQFAVRSISGTGAQRQEYWTFLGVGRQQVGRRSGPTDYAPADRTWYRQALSSPGVVLSQPYPFQSLGGLGISASVAFAGGRKVLGVDLALQDLQSFLSSQRVSARGGIVLQDSQRHVLAQTAGYTAFSDGLSLKAARRVEGLDLEILFSAPADDFGSEYRTMEVAVALATLVLLALLLPLTMLFASRLTRIMTVLSYDVDRVCRMDFAGDSPQGSKIAEFDRLARGFATMKATLASETGVLADAQLKLKKIVETGIALSTEKDSNTLCQKILDTAKDLTDADGGTLYLLNEKGRYLAFNIMLNDTLGTRYGGTSGVPVPPGLKVQLYKANGEENHHNVASHAFLTGNAINIVDAYNDDRFDFSGTKTFDQSNGYRSQSFLTIPLKPMGGQVLGCLQLINAKGPDGAIVPFTQDMQDFVEALAASAATAIYNRQLLDDLEQLFDAIIDIINGAIGRKSPYTGGHCERVPIIATELAKVTSAVTTGPLAGFRLDAQQLREFVLAAKLHDVGKVTTPEYVVDKSTKLETIYNRIHEVRTRFEVLYRDAVIRRHEAVLADPAAATAADTALADTVRALADDWAFLAQSNLGTEFLSAENAERIRTIGARPWRRYFDDRLGLGWEEAARLQDVPAPTLPAPTTLLTDDPRHIFPRQTSFAEVYKTADGASYPFRTKVPELLYNHGEVHNLTVSRGTLTEEEHFKIKEHVMQSIYMLDRLPWPKGLERVPVIAGEHHETLTGDGYPYQRSAADLSVQSRILAIADIFEALTAHDRPYKKPKTLSEAVRILYGFKQSRHIDGDLFDLFLTTGVYREFALVYLRPEQIDEVDIAPYLGPGAA